MKADVTSKSMKEKEDIESVDCIDCVDYDDVSKGCDDHEITDICDYPYIGLGAVNKPGAKYNKKTLTEDDIERMTY